MMTAVRRHGRDGGWSAQVGPCSVHGCATPWGALAVAAAGGWDYWRQTREPRLYIDTDDQWMGRFRDRAKGYEYICVLPCVVFRFRRAAR